MIARSPRILWFENSLNLNDFSLSKNLMIRHWVHLTVFLHWFLGPFCRKLPLDLSSRFGVLFCRYYWSQIYALCKTISQDSQSMPKMICSERGQFQVFKILRRRASGRLSLVYGANSHENLIWITKQACTFPFILSVRCFISIFLYNLMRLGNYKWIIAWNNACSGFCSLKYLKRILYRKGRRQCSWEAILDGFDQLFKKLDISWSKSSQQF